VTKAKRPRGSVVLLSGGMDSATCLALAVRKDRPVHALTLVYGQRHAREVASARALARHFGADSHAVVRLPVAPLLGSSLTHPDPNRRPIPPGRRKGIPPTYVPARNAIFLSIALGYAETRRAGSIYLGVNAIDYSGYPDCRPAFLRAFERLARVATKVGVDEGWAPAVRAPLLRLSKAEIVRRGERLHVPWAMTWSCYSGGRRPCRVCDACRLRARGFDDAGVSDPTLA
jgi:7-cyano-7-deazaguanine synthase